jgi:hypothetical protein
MVCRLTSLLCSTQHDVEMFLQFALTNKLIKLAWTQADFIGDFMLGR